MNGLLLLLAHPDDESFMLAATAARAVGEGRRVALVCATRGQAGAMGDPPLCGRDELPALREAELREACAILGIDLVALLDHEDRRVAEASTDEMRATLVRHVRTERPAVVVTFDPAGVTGHPDHVAMMGFTLDAVTAAADARWLPDLGPAHRVRRIVWPSPVLPWDESRPAALARRGGVDFVIDTRAWRDAKIRALRAHRTQHRSVQRHWFDDVAPGVDPFATETFRLAWGEPPPSVPADDLFAGL